MTALSAGAALLRALGLLVDRVEALEARARGGDEAAWPAYCDAVRTLAAVIEQAAPGKHGQLLSTAEMAERLAIAPKTLLRRRAEGKVRPPVVLGKRGRAALRWRGDEAAR